MRELPPESPPIHCLRAAWSSQVPITYSRKKKGQLYSKASNHPHFQGSSSIASPCEAIRVRNKAWMDHWKRRKPKLTQYPFPASSFHLQRLRILRLISIAAAVSPSEETVPNPHKSSELKGLREQST